MSGFESNRCWLFHVSAFEDASTISKEEFVSVWDFDIDLRKKVYHDVLLLSLRAGELTNDRRNGMLFPGPIEQREMDLPGMTVARLGLLCIQSKSTQRKGKL